MQSKACHSQEALEGRLEADASSPVEATKGKPEAAPEPITGPAHYKSYSTRYCAALHYLMADYMEVRS